MNIKFRRLRIDDMMYIVTWRNDCLESLRTSYSLTREMQEEWYKNTVCNRNSNARYWAIEAREYDECVTGTYVNDKLIGMCGIENIEWENRLGEISVIIAPDYRKKGYGEEVVRIVLCKGFYELNLENIYGEVYHANRNAVAFWKKIIKKYKGYETILVNRKYWDNVYWNSTYFNFYKNRYNK